MAVTEILQTFTSFPNGIALVFAFHIIYMGHAAKALTRRGLELLR